MNSYWPDSPMKNCPPGDSIRDQTSSPVLVTKNHLEGSRKFTIPKKGHVRRIARNRFCHNQTLRLHYETCDLPSNMCSLPRFFRGKNTSETGKSPPSCPCRNVSPKVEITPSVTIADLRAQVASKPSQSTKHR